MGVFDSIKGKVKKTIQNTRENIQQNRDLKQSKRRALELFTMTQLKKLCDEEGIGHPPLYSTDLLTGERRKKIWGNPDKGLLLRLSRLLSGSYR